MKSPLFVISPIGQKDTPQRKQADDILDFVKEETRDAHDVIRGDEQSNARIADAILDSLQRYPFVVAYLGSERNGTGWNPNVMFEVGYRLATGKPLVLLAHEDESVPFDLKDFRHVSIPPAEKLPYKKNLNYGQYNDVANALSTAIQAPGHCGVLESPFAIGDFFIDLTPGCSKEEQERNSIFLRASDKANRLFHTSMLFKDEGANVTLVGKQFAEVDRRLEPLIKEKQWKEFVEDQESLFGKLLLKRPDIEAKIPFVFKDTEPVDPAFRGRAFLPLMTDYEIKENGLAFRVLYLEIPSKMRHDNDVLRVDASDYRDWLNDLKTHSSGSSPHSNGSDSPLVRNGDNVPACRHHLEGVPS